MARKFKDLLTAMPQERQERIREDAERRLLMLSLSEVRKKRNISQKTLAANLNITQPAVSKMETEQNVGIETLKKYAGGMGGELILTVSFPGGESYRIG
jgi:transcriptional regulator with XRE-family HTH domain